MEQNVLDTVQRNPITSVRVVTAALAAPQSRVYRISRNVKACIHTIFKESITTAMDLAARIVCAAADTQENPGVFEQIHQSIVQRFNECIASNGGNIFYMFTYLPRCTYLQRKLTEKFQMFSLTINRRVVFSQQKGGNRGRSVLLYHFRDYFPFYEFPTPGKRMQSPE
ncbi:hypothetical protein TNCV_4600841 [Trichonephila clavipes]|nr:hypothetical protein TNCV_4600841 [Trichonephila clavipes]